MDRKVRSGRGQTGLPALMSTCRALSRARMVTVPPSSMRDASSWEAVLRGMWSRLMHAMDGNT
eukprot:9216882-Alexandrium_andersonii.AAC.1